MSDSRESLTVRVKTAPWLASDQLTLCRNFNKESESPVTFDTATKQLVLNRKESTSLKDVINDLTFAAQFPCPDAAKLSAEALVILKKLDDCVIHPSPRVRSEPATTPVPSAPKEQPSLLK